MRSARMVGHMPELREQVLWAGLAVLCYVAAGFAFLAVVAEAGIIGSNPEQGSIGSASLPGLLVSVVLFVVGGYAMNRARRTRTTRPEQSSLPPQYRSKPPSGESSADPSEKTDDGRAVRCPDCGGENAADYAFCRHCSAELSE